MGAVRGKGDSRCGAAGVASASLAGVGGVGGVGKAAAVGAAVAAVGAATALVALDVAADAAVTLAVDEAATGTALIMLARRAKHSLISRVASWLATAMPILAIFPPSWAWPA